MFTCIDHGDICFPMAICHQGYDHQIKDDEVLRSERLHIKFGYDYDKPSKIPPCMPKH